MLRLRLTDGFQDWLDGLRDTRARDRIAARLLRARNGNLGDVKYFGGIGEMRVAHGPGYRLYFVRRGDVVVVLLCGGDKSTQDRDVKRAIALAQEV